MQPDRWRPDDFEPSPWEAVLVLFAGIAIAAFVLGMAAVGLHELWGLLTHAVRGDA